MRLLLAPLALLALAGCGPLHSSSLISDADRALAEARDAGVPEQLPYEYAMAETYLEEARSVANHAHYAEASDYAERALGLARAARRKVTGAPAGDHP